MSFLTDHILQLAKDMSRRDLKTERTEAQLHQLDYLKSIQEAAEEEMQRVVTRLRQQEKPCSWARIGEATGITKQGAAQRWGSSPKATPVDADPRRRVSLEDQPLPLDAT